MSCLTGLVDSVSIADPQLRALLRQFACDIDAIEIEITAGEVSEIRFPIALVSRTSTTLLPVGAVIQRAELDIRTAYTAGTLLAVGTPINPSAFITTAQNNPQVAPAIYGVNQDLDIAGGVPVQFTVSGVAPLVGSGFVVVRYSLPLP